jgi:hypothetical protein
LDDQHSNTVEEDWLDDFILPSTPPRGTTQVAIISYPLPTRTPFEQVASSPSTLSSELLPGNLSEVEITTVFTSEPGNNCSAGVRTAILNLDANIVSGNTNKNCSLYIIFDRIERRASLHEIVIMYEHYKHYHISLK